MNPEEEYRLHPADTVLQGLWIDVGSRMEKDATWQRIEWLVTEHLEELARNDANAARLYRDPDDGRLWEWFPVRAELGKKSPPHLALIDARTAKERFRVPV